MDCRFGGHLPYQSYRPCQYSIKEVPSYRFNTMGGLDSNPIRYEPLGNLPELNLKNSMLIEDGDCILTLLDDEMR